ncbi:PREDICTED: methyl-CpG-binding domain protein 1 isoform X9 [Chinchilla lanigera]|uniref:methyl-CpG-binding domain protein 1 isoform X9 n=1 Tax=Chinchilla lanigera TaxID=34839 RepID=UPI000697DF5C|nr:PREDICTED: methyl-CpG-binding domain protein 1 isoform X9 [Chinchilla lanigera]
MQGAGFTSGAEPEKQATDFRFREQRTAAETTATVWRRRLRRRKSRARRDAQAGPSPWVRGPRAAEATGLVPSWLLLLPEASMAEDWLDCPALGPGWKRREVYRKSGATCGRSDTYYQSPTGDRIRSKVELTRYLGPACDLSLFDFKQGILCYSTPKARSVAVPSKKRKKASKPAKAQKRHVGPQKSKVRKETREDEAKADTDTAPASFPAPGCCENCGISFSGDGTGRQRLKTLCKDCRAQRIAFNREQRMFKRVGCGECAACRVTEDCGACSTCLLQLPHDVASGLFCKCERRRCLRIVERSRGCGVCRGCQTQEDCGRCRVCLRPPRPGLRRQWRCVQRRCLRGKRGRRRGGSDSKTVAQQHSQAQSLPTPPAAETPEPVELHASALVPSPPAEVIYYWVDEDELKRLLPSTGSGSEEWAGSPSLYPRRKRPGSARRPRLGPTVKSPLTTRTARPGRAQAPLKQEAGGGFVLPPPGTDLVFLREGASSPVQVPGPATASTEAPLQAVDPGLPPVKQEPPDPEEGKEENKDGCVSESAPEEEAGGAGTPVITEIFSLGGTRFRDTAAWLPSSQAKCPLWPDLARSTLRTEFWKQPNQDEMLQSHPATNQLLRVSLLA